MAEDEIVKYWDCLCDDVKLEIVTFLPFQSFSRVMATSNANYELIINSPRVLKLFSSSTLHKIPKKRTTFTNAVFRLRVSPLLFQGPFGNMKLKKYLVFHEEFTNIEKHVRKKHRKAFKTMLNQFHPKDTLLKKISKFFPNIQQLEATNVIAKDSDFKLLSNISSLNIASCSENTFVGTGLTFLSRENLKRLNIAHCRQLKDEHLSVLAEFTKLKNVNISHCKNITSCKCFPHVVRLNCAKTEISDFSDISKTVEVLNVKSCEKIKDESLANLPKLKWLNICETGITDKGIAHLNSPLLNTLIVRECSHVEGIGIGKLTSLESLVIDCNGEDFLEQLDILLEAKVKIFPNRKYRMKYLELESLVRRQNSKHMRSFHDIEKLKIATLSVEIEAGNTNEWDWVENGFSNIKVLSIYIVEGFANVFGMERHQRFFGYYADTSRDGVRKTRMILSNFKKCFAVNQLFLGGKNKEGNESPLDALKVKYFGTSVSTGDFAICLMRGKNDRDVYEEISNHFREIALSLNVSKTLLKEKAEIIEKKSPNKPMFCVECNKFTKIDMDSTECPLAMFHLPKVPESDLPRYERRCYFAKEITVNDKNVYFRAFFPSYRVALDTLKREIIEKKENTWCSFTGHSSFIKFYLDVEFYRWKEVSGVWKNENSEYLIAFSVDNKLEKEKQNWSDAKIMESIIQKVTDIVSENLVVSHLGVQPGATEHFSVKPVVITSACSKKKMSFHVVFNFIMKSEELVQFSSKLEGICCIANEEKTLVPLIDLGVYKQTQLKLAYCGKRGDQTRKHLPVIIENGILSSNDYGSPEEKFELVKESMICVAPNTKIVVLCSPGKCLTILKNNLSVLMWKMKTLHERHKSLELMKNEISRLEEVVDRKEKQVQNLEKKVDEKSRSLLEKEVERQEFQREFEIEKTKFFQFRNNQEEKLRQNQEILEKKRIEFMSYRDDQMKMLHERQKQLEEKAQEEKNRKV